MASTYCCGATENSSSKSDAPPQTLNTIFSRLFVNPFLLLIFVILAVPFIVIGRLMGTEHSITKLKSSASTTSSKWIELIESLDPQSEIISIMPPHTKQSRSLLRFSPIINSIASAEFTVPSYFTTDESTEENYHSNDMEFYGSYKSIRTTLEYSYFGNYIMNRQLFQDEIVNKLLDSNAWVHDEKNGTLCKAPTDPWIVFTAGVMGAGKTYVIQQLASNNRFPLESYINVDPDIIREQFPEYYLYDPTHAAERTQKEAGYIEDIAIRAALDRGYNVLVDGSLRNGEFYYEYFRDLKKRYEKLRIAILYVTAPRDVIIDRVKKRFIKTGRAVPESTLEEAMQQVPTAIETLAPLADYFCEFDNSQDFGDITLITAGVTWESFQRNWLQTCPPNEATK